MINTIRYKGIDYPITGKLYRHEVTMTGWEGVSKDIKGTLTLYSTSNKSINSIGDIIAAIGCNGGVGTLVPICYDNNKYSSGTAALYSPDGCTLHSRGTMTADCVVCMEGSCGCDPYCGPYGCTPCGPSDEPSDEPVIDELAKYQIQAHSEEFIDWGNWYPVHLYKTNPENLWEYEMVTDPSTITEEDSLKLGVDLTSIGQGMRFFTGYLYNHSSYFPEYEYWNGDSGELLATSEHITHAVDVKVVTRISDDPSDEGTVYYSLQFPYFTLSEPQTEITGTLDVWGSGIINFAINRVSDDNAGAAPANFLWHPDTFSFIERGVDGVNTAHVGISLSTIETDAVIPYGNPYSNPYSGPYGSGCTNPNCTCETKTVLCNGEIVNFEQIMDIVVDDSASENSIRYIFREESTSFYLTTDPNYVLAEQEVETDEATYREAMSAIYNHKKVYFEVVDGVLTLIYEE